MKTIIKFPEAVCINNKFSQTFDSDEHLEVEVTVESDFVILTSKTEQVKVPISNVAYITTYLQVVEEVKQMEDKEVRELFQELNSIASVPPNFNLSEQDQNVLNLISKKSKAGRKKKDESK